MAILSPCRSHHGWSEETGTLTEAVCVTTDGSLRVFEADRVQIVDRAVAEAIAAATVPRNASGSTREGCHPLVMAVRPAGHMLAPPDRPGPHRTPVHRPPTVPAQVTSGAWAGPALL